MMIFSSSSVRLWQRSMPLVSVSASASAFQPERSVLRLSITPYYCFSSGMRWPIYEAMISVPSTGTTKSLSSPASAAALISPCPARAVPAWSTTIERSTSKVCRFSAIAGMLHGKRARVLRKRRQLADQSFISWRGIGASDELGTSTGSYLGVGVLNASLQRWGMLVIGHAGAGDRPMPECIQTNDDERRLHRLPYLSHSNRCAMLVSTLQ